jgi:hypothetical protein
MPPYSTWSFGDERNRQHPGGVVVVIKASDVMVGK